MPIKIFLFSLFALLAKESKSQFKKVEFSGVVKGAKNGTIRILIDPTTDTNIIVIKNKTVPLKNGVFNISGSLKYPHTARIIVNDSIYSNEFFLEPGNLKGTFVIEDKNHVLININSKVNIEDETDFKNAFQSIDRKGDLWFEENNSLHKKYFDRLPPSLNDSMRNAKLRINDIRDSIIYEYIKNHKKSYVGLWNLYNTVAIKGFTTLRYSTLKKFDPSLQKTPTGIKIKSILDGDKKISIGQIMPIIKIVDEREIRKEINYKSKQYTLIDFWFSHCGPCLSQFPELLEVYKKYRNKNIEIIGISVDKTTDKKDWLVAIKSYDLSWPQYWDKNNKETTKLGILSFPQNLLVDAQGKIVRKDLSPSELAYFLEKAL